ncbi:MAG: AAA family ATPase [bacterium]
MIAIEKIKVKNYLTLRDVDLELKNLNVLIGPNGAGKSNLLDVFSLINEAVSGAPQQGSLRNAIIKNRRGMDELLWDHGSESKEMEFTVHISDDEKNIQKMFVKFYSKLYFSLRLEQQSKQSASYDITHEAFKPVNHKALARPPDTSLMQQQLDFYDRDRESRVTFTSVGTLRCGREPSDINVGEGKLKYPQELVVIQKTDEKLYPYVARLKDYLSSWTIHTYFDTSMDARMRAAQEVYAETRLSHKGDNLPLVLQHLHNSGEWEKTISPRIKDLYEYFLDISFQPEGAGKIQLSWKEKNLEKGIPASRLSDGALRFLCLVAILCNPDPAPLICIDEPETGFHPDALLTISEMLKEASKKTQIIVTTHSPDLVSCFEDPENVVVVERGVDGGTSFRRLSLEELKPWLEEEMSLGTIWRGNLFGGNRW